METRGFQDGPVRWACWHERAVAALVRRYRTDAGLTPRQVAEIVAGVLPAWLGRGLLDQLAARGWLLPAARIPFAVLDSDACPPEFRGPLRGIVRLAVFGLPGQGRPDFKHRESVYQQLCAQIMREAADLNTLALAANRALGDPDVCRDPTLAGMVRGFIAEREAELRAKLRVEAGGSAHTSYVRRAFDEGLSPEFPTRQQLVNAFLKHERDFEVHLAQYNEAAARYALDKMQDLARRFPVHVDQAVVQRHAQQFDEFAQRCAAMRQQIEQVARQAVEAARRGDEPTAQWLIRRLRAIHELTPVLLPAERFEALREEIERSGAEHEHREAAHELTARKREVATEIKQAGAAIYRFQKVARTSPPESDEYKRAERAYWEAVARVRVRDTEWLTGLLLELETYLEDLHDPSGKAQEQLDRFIETVRTALNQLRLVIRQTQQERAEAAKARQAHLPPPGDGDAAAPPSQ